MGFDPEIKNIQEVDRIVFEGKTKKNTSAKIESTDKLEFENKVGFGEQQQQLKNSSRGQEISDGKIARGKFSDEVIHTEKHDPTPELKNTSQHLEHTLNKNNREKYSDGILYSENYKAPNNGKESPNVQNYTSKSEIDSPTHEGINYGSQRATFSKKPIRFELSDDESSSTNLKNVDYMTKDFNITPRMESPKNKDSLYKQHVIIINTDRRR
jgi:hypothetical protein